MSVVLILAQSKPVSRKYHEQCNTKAGSGQCVLIVVETSLFCVHLVYTVWQMSPLHPFCNDSVFPIAAAFYSKQFREKSCCSCLQQVCFTCFIPSDVCYSFLITQIRKNSTAIMS